MARTRNPKPFSAIAGEMYQTLGMREAFLQFKALEAWGGVVGPAIARATTVERFSDGQLFVRVRNSSWRMELNYRKVDIVRQLNAVLEKPMVKEIIFR
ncbi:DUF721 domain-containing protein [Pelodictyon luteolum]|uniref:DUF721 domain-containing protein n=1 Tax=Chlorobium luteolum (strain DSM 273 / BCRC 81028 / 2530) TaxID=319225 RepID=Q3B6Y6_CHLL3|nr:DUF721 domain-containing protein [Pelodictyon luteolum]ABB22895.1 conserved hypothetical protein [Pelodictyon luteolum DSM 273]